MSTTRAGSPTLRSATFRRPVTWALGLSKHHQLRTPMSLEDAEREARIDNEIVVDCYTESERALGWYYYLDDKLSFPFKATCVLSLRTSPLRLGEEVQVVSMAEEDNCMREMYVRVEYGANLLELPLRQLLCQSRSRSTQQALQDWYYWQFRGYEF